MFKTALNVQISPQLDFWTDDQCNTIHLAALEILERTGVKVYEEESLKLLKDAGCLVKENLVKYPAALVEWAIKSAPERIVVSSTDKKRSLFLQKNTANYGMCNDCPWFFDTRTQDIRTSLLSDVEDAAKVADVLDNIDFVGSLALASDVTVELTDLYQFRAMRKYTKKPILGSTLDKFVMQAMIDMAIVSAGSTEEFKRNPSFVVYTEPTTPLVNTQEALEKLLICADYGVPVTYAPGPMSGATSPITLAGTVALGIAESLSGLVIHQLRKKGAPFILACLAGPMDLSTTVGLYGDPLVAVFNAASGAMGNFYKLPTYGMSGTVDACVLDLQAAMEATFSIATAAWSGTNLIHDNGYTGSGMIGNLEHLVMTDEIISSCKRFMQGISFNEETLATEVIHDVGPGGHYFMSEHTLKYFKQETWYPRFMHRKHYSLWQKSDGKDMGQKMHEMVLSLLNSPECNGVSPGELDEMDRIIAEQEARVKNSGRSAQKGVKKQ